MGNKQRKIKRKAAAKILRKTGGVPPITLAVADPVAAFIQTIPETDSSTQITLKNAIHRVVKNVSVNRPQKGPLKKVKLQPKKILMDRLTLRKDEEGTVILEILPGDPIATLDGKPWRRPKVENGETEGTAVV